MCGLLFTKYSAEDCIRDSLRLLLENNLAELSDSLLMPIDQLILSVCIILNLNISRTSLNLLVTLMCEIREVCMSCTAMSLINSGF